MNSKLKSLAGNAAIALGSATLLIAMVMTWATSNGIVVW